MNTGHYVQGKWMGKARQETSLPLRRWGTVRYMNVEWKLYAVRLYEHLGDRCFKAELRRGKGENAERVFAVVGDDLDFLLPDGQWFRSCDSYEDWKQLTGWEPNYYSEAYDNYPVRVDTMPW